MRLQDDLERWREWLEHNGLHINRTKIGYMLVSVSIGEILKLQNILQNTSSIVTDITQRTKS